VHVHVLVHVLVHDETQATDEVDVVMTHKHGTRRALDSANQIVYVYVHVTRDTCTSRI